MTRTAVDNAVEFGRHERFGGWALGLLVACSVEPDVGNGNRHDRNTSGKISANAFARQAGTTPSRVRRYYDAWDRAAAKRIVYRASTLTPDDVSNDNLPEGYDWTDYFDGSSDRASSGDAVERFATRVDNRGAASVVNELPAETQVELLNALASKKNAANRLTPENRQKLEGDIRAHDYIAPDHSGVLDAVDRNLRRALGDESDRVVDQLQRARAGLVSAIRMKEQYGVTDKGGERKVLADLHRLLELYGTAASRWSTGDDEFLDAIGVVR